MTVKQLSTISNALDVAYNYLYDSLDAICDKSYYEETQHVLMEIKHAKEILVNTNNIECTSS